MEVKQEELKEYRLKQIPNGDWVYELYIGGKLVTKDMWFKTSRRALEAVLKEVNKLNKTFQ